MGNHIGSNIRRLRGMRSKSQAQLAAAICRAAGVTGSPVGRQEVSRYERGVRTPEEWLPYIAIALGVPVSALVSPPPEEPPPPALSDYLPDDNPLTSVGSSFGRRLGTADVQQLGKRVHGLRLADDVLSGGDLMRPALRELRTALRQYQESSYTDAVGKELLRMIGELAQIAGWISSDAGQRAEAERIYRMGLSAADRAGDTTLAGNLLGCLAYQQTNTGQVREGLTAARAALEMAGDAPPRARALYLDRTAWAYAMAGESQPAVRALGEAGEALSQHEEEEEPGYLYWVDSGELRIMESRVFTELHRPLRAVPILRDVLGRYDATHTRELALYLSWLAVAYADANEPEEAASIARRILTLASDTASERISDRVQVVLSRLSRYAEVPEVREILNRAA